MAPLERRRALRMSLLDGALHAVMLGASESYLGALAVELGHRDVALSLLATLPLLAGALAQLAGPRLVRVVGGEKRLVLIGVAIQALAHLGFAALALTGSESLELFLAVKILYWVSAMGHAPAWSAWMARLVPPPLRAGYFSRRLAVHQAVVLVVFLGAGLSLEAFRDLGEALVGFAVLHGLALVARAAGVLVLVRQAAMDGPRDGARPTIRETLRASRWRVALFAAVMLFGAQLAVPFFTPYMLGPLGLDLAEFALLVSVSIAAKVVAFPLWRRLLVTTRPLVVLGASGALIALVPFLWVVDDSLAWLALAQLVGGAAWAGYELVSLELLMGDAPEHARVEFFALAGTLSGVTQVLGALIGGLLLRTATPDYHTVFLYSAVGRGAALLLLFPLAMTALRRMPVLSRIVSVRPNAGAVQAPVLLSAPPPGGGGPATPRPRRPLPGS